MDNIGADQQACTSAGACAMTREETETLFHTANPFNSAYDVANIVRGDSDLREEIEISVERRNSEVLTSPNTQCQQNSRKVHVASNICDTGKTVQLRLPSESSMIIDQMRRVADQCKIQNKLTNQSSHFVHAELFFNRKMLVLIVLLVAICAGTAIGIMVSSLYFQSYYGPVYEENEDVTIGNKLHKYDSYTHQINQNCFDTICLKTRQI